MEIDRELGVGGPFFFISSLTLRIPWGVQAPGEGVRDMLGGWEVGRPISTSTSGMQRGPMGFDAGADWGIDEVRCRLGPMAACLGGIGKDSRFL